MDMTCPGLISEFCLDEGVLGIHKASMMKLRSASELRVIKLDSLRFGVIDTETTEGVDSIGEPINIQISPTTRSEVEPYLIDMDKVFATYSVIELGHLPEFSGYDYGTLLKYDTAGRYSCGVAAAFVVSQNYGCFGSSLTSDFRIIWNYVNPWEAPGGWASKVTDIKNGVVKFCRSHGKTIGGDIYSSQPDFGKIKSLINARNLGVLGLSKGESFHAVTVEGYAIVAAGNLVLTNMALVYDGWHSYARFLYYDAPWDSVSAVLFNGR